MSPWLLRSPLLVLAASAVLAGCATSSGTPSSTPSPSATAAPVAKPIAVKVFVASMFEIGKNTGDRAGEFAVYRDMVRTTAERLSRYPAGSVIRR